MSKLKKLIFALLATCVAVGVGAGAAACTKNFSKYPEYKQPANYNPADKDPSGDGNDEKYNGVYIIHVQSMGGLKLNGVSVTAVARNGSASMSGISLDGVVEFALEKGIYDIEIDQSTLPEGYYIPEDKEFVTEPEKANVEVNIPSRVISHTASSNTRYSLGDIMYDFGYSEIEGTKYTLAGLFDDPNIKAVVLNFFFTTCSPCQAEFPAIEKAYQAYNGKLALIALSNQDTLSDIKSFKESYGLSFHMAYDSAGITSMFSINNFPTTVIIDRYGSVAYRSMGTLPNEAVWKGLFNKYTSDDYQQENPDEKPDDTLPTERVKPTPGLEMPSSESISQAINGKGTDGKVYDYRPETNEKDAEYSWPWIIEKDAGNVSSITASNSKGGFSFAIIYATVELNNGEALSYEYNVDTEAEHDYLYSLINGQIVGTHSGNSDGWKEAQAVYIADHKVTLTLSFIYIKDQQKDVGADKASIRNINIRPISEIQTTVDQRIAVVDSLTLENGKYMKDGELFEVGYIKEPTANDPYYYVNYVDLNGKMQTALLLVDFNFSTLWAEKHLGSSKFVTSDNAQKDATLYLLSFFNMSNHDSVEADGSKASLEFNYGHSEELIESYYLQNFSDNQLLPINKERKAILDAFIKEFYNSNKALLTEGDQYYEDQWLEFCYYFMHFGGKHEDGVICSQTDNPIMGLSYETAFKAQLGKNHVNVTKMLNLGDGGGVKYSFVPEHTGVYLFRSETIKTGVDPLVIVLDNDKNELAEQDDDLRLGHYSNDNFYVYVYLEAGKTYYVHGAMHYALSTGEYNMYIEYTGETYKEMLRTASTAYGMWTYDPDNTDYEYYLAINASINPNDGYYHHVTDDYNYGSVVYVDFLHSNYFDSNGHTLLELIENGVFNFKTVDYTARIKQYYYKSINNKKPDDEKYGLVEADKTLVSILNTLIRMTHGNGPEANAWMMFACYYESYGVPSGN